MGSAKSKQIEMLEERYQEISCRLNNSLVGTFRPHFSGKKNIVFSTEKREIKQEFPAIESKKLQKKSVSKKDRSQGKREVSKTLEIAKRKELSDARKIKGSYESKVSESTTIPKRVAKEDSRIKEKKNNGKEKPNSQKRLREGEKTPESQKSQKETGAKPNSQKRLQEGEKTPESQKSQKETGAKPNSQKRLREGEKTLESQKSQKETGAKPNSQKRLREGKKTPESQKSQKETGAKKTPNLDFGENQGNQESKERKKMVKVIDADKETDYNNKRKSKDQQSLEKKKEQSTLPKLKKDRMIASSAPSRCRPRISLRTKRQKSESNSLKGAKKAKLLSVFSKSDRDTPRSPNTGKNESFLQQVVSKLLQKNKETEAKLIEAIEKKLEAEIGLKNTRSALMEMKTRDENSDKGVLSLKSKLCESENICSKLFVELRKTSEENVRLNSLLTQKESKIQVLYEEQAEQSRKLSASTLEVSESRRQNDKLRQSLAEAESEASLLEFQIDQTHIDFPYKVNWDPHELQFYVDFIETLAKNKGDTIIISFPKEWEAFIDEKMSYVLKKSKKLGGLLWLQPSGISGSRIHFKEDGFVKVDMKVNPNWSSLEESRVRVLDKQKGIDVTSKSIGSKSFHIKITQKVSVLEESSASLKKTSLIMFPINSLLTASANGSKAKK